MCLVLETITTFTDLFEANSPASGLCFGWFGQGAKKEGLIEGERGAPVTVKTAKCKEAEIAPKPKKPKEPKEKAVFMEHGESH